MLWFFLFKKLTLWPELWWFSFGWRSWFSSSQRSQWSCQAFARTQGCCQEWQAWTNNSVQTGCLGWTEKWGFSIWLRGFPRTQNILLSSILVSLWREWKVALPPRPPSTEINMFECLEQDNTALKKTTKWEKCGKCQEAVDGCLRHCFNLVGADVCSQLPSMLYLDLSLPCSPTFWAAMLLFCLCHSVGSRGFGSDGLFMLLPVNLENRLTNCCFWELGVTSAGVRNMALLSQSCRWPCWQVQVDWLPGQSWV